MKAIIFDVDGVIVDVRESYHYAIKETAEFFLGQDVPVSVVKEIKFKKAINNDWDVTYEVIKEFGGEVEYSELVEKFTEIYEKLKYREKQLLSVEFFKELKSSGVPLGIVTGRPKGDLEFVLNRFNLRDFFDVTVDEDDVVDKNLRKPHPFPLHMCMESLGADMGIYVGDNNADREMVYFYRKIYGKPMKFVHFKRVVDIEVPADFETQSEEELKSFLLGEASRNLEGERVYLP
ncbi:HAD superfamily phosphatase [Hydrogenivirga caldilitoris]|uniref:phosphoglycolate phosphatase n=1 Tax=Hydrogenivirga caldilitoris TaxID=246264 RepID=A0A497XXD7_9AQUI|nr:HAD-IA family hydrolase [Hydrogenivirga caldilitoris]RLJ71433.1 HAD superfamily phosphatase [Hydrogenivirga caldilitoris]